MPNSRRWWLFGIQIMPPDMAVVPPRYSLFSRTATVAPALLAHRAAVRAAPPDPTMTMSNWSTTFPVHVFTAVLNCSDLWRMRTRGPGGKSRGSGHGPPVVTCQSHRDHAL